MKNLDQLYIVHYPDPHLRRACEPVTAFDETLATLARRMLALMQTGRGVGLAAPQVGVNRRLFVMNATGKPGDELIFVNPAIRDAHGSAEGEEGCLSLPGIHAQVRRAQRCRVTAQDLEGRPFEALLEDLPARICQHETDHLNGVLILDRMGPSDRLATRRTVKALEAAHHGHTKTRAAR